MRANLANRQTDLEGLVAELTEAAYGFALRHGFKGSFVEVELGLWDAIRACQGRIEKFASAAPDRTIFRSAPSRFATMPDSITPVLSVEGSQRPC